MISLLLDIKVVASSLLINIVPPCFPPVLRSHDSMFGKRKRKRLLKISVSNSEEGAF